MSIRKKEQFTKLIRHSIDLYLAQNIELFGFAHVIDVNMAEDLKTAFVYVSCPVEKSAKNLENIITGDNKQIVDIFKESFTSKFIPKLKYIFIMEEDAKF